MSISKATASASYRPNGYGMSPALKKARRPFVIRNAITGTAIAAFAVGVWAYSISAVKQDNFDDIDAEANAAGLIKKQPRPS
ncbi:coiled-coil protein [Rhizoctonia solani 123E]|uniref:Cytochrome c oxidase assembly factor 3 n=1 Tax=Rhizoctonia solani 123E TaxID=1423351 RepID=A0A074S123_9AGAM|nr:coiled-coil protein [Rhizoctonia solani 123E]